MRGYFGIGAYHPKNSINIGTLWRSAYIYGAAFIFTVGRRYEKQASDTIKAYRHVPLFNFLTFDELREKIPFDCQVVCVELDAKAIPLHEFKHPERAIYLLGAEDHGIPQDFLRRYKTIRIESALEHSLNVSVAGTVVMYDRHIKE